MAGPENWNPSFFPPGVFQDHDIVDYKLLTQDDRRKYMKQVVDRVVLSKESKVE